MPGQLIDHLISQHVEETAFHWLARNLAVEVQHYSLKDLAHLDTRLEANIDGLRVAGDAGWRLCMEEMTLEDPGEVFTAAVQAFESKNEQRVERVLEAGAQSLDLSRGLSSALGWLPHDRALPFITRLIKNANPLLRRAGIAAAAIHRHDVGHDLTRALHDPDPVVRARALRAAGELARYDLTQSTHDALRYRDPECRFWGAWSAALLGERDALDVLREIAESDSPRAERAADMAVRRMNPADAVKWQQRLAAKPERTRLAIKVAGAIGDPALIPWLIDQVRIPELMRVAGEAFSMVTGVDITDEDLEGDRPGGFDPGPNDDPEDENVEMDPDEDLPYPNPKVVEQWWTKHGGSFRPGVRHLLGKPMTNESLKNALQHGYQRQRAAAALELAILNPDQPLFEVRAPGFRQQQMLG